MDTEDPARSVHWSRKMAIDSDNPSVYRPVITQRVGTCSPGVDAAGLSWRNGLLVRATNWLGDTVMTLPAVFKLRQLAPQSCGLFVLCPKALAPVWEAAPCVSHVVAMEGRRAGRHCRAFIRRLGPGAAVVLPNSFGAALDVLRAGVPVRVGRGGRCRNLLLTHCLDAWPRDASTGSHEVSHYLEIAAAFGDIAWDTSFDTLCVERTEETTARLGMSCERGKQWLALAPGAAYGPAKQWPAANFRAVAEEWISRGGSVVVTGTARERGAADLISRGLDACLNLAGSSDLSGLMAVLSRADCAVANDSGAMHLAAALGTPGVAIFGSTDPTATGPLGAPWVVLSANVECSPCFSRTCRRTREQYLCLRKVSVEMVCDALNVVLAAAPGLEA